MNPELVDAFVIAEGVSTYIFFLLGTVDSLGQHKLSPVLRGTVYGLVFPPTAWTVFTLTNFL